MLAIGLMSSACTDGPVAPETSDVEADLGKLGHVSAPILSSQRTELGENIAHYTYDLAMGDGPYDVVRLHRIVRERRPNKPIRTREALFLLPGSPNYFEAIFVAPLVSQAVAWDHSIAVFLAQNDVDVWGMDYAWALVPASEAELDFMEGWGLQRDIDHASTALSVARSIRASTGQRKSGKLDVLGFSYGGIVAYPLLGQETQRPPRLRNVKGLIALDVGAALAEESHRTYYCGVLAADQASLDAGVYSDDSGLFLTLLGDLATALPNEPSPIFGGFTNLQAALFLGARTELVTGQFWHFVGGGLDGYDIPSDLRYSDTQLWLDLLRTIPPHLPMQANVDVGGLLCGSDAGPFYDHLAEIAVPILHVGAAGGFGPSAYHTATLTASNDITTLTVQLQADADRAIDFGHADLTLGADADELVWRPILDWLLAKSEKSKRSDKSKKSRKG
jgi:hypothetical protein